MSEPAPDALRRLEERLNRASEAAERLAAEAARAVRGDRPPPAGWQAPDADEPPPGRSEFELLLAGIGALGELVPPEVLTRLVAAFRELLLALRALIDFYVERLERPRPARDDVRDIPID